MVENEEEQGDKLGEHQEGEEEDSGRRQGRPSWREALDVVVLWRRRSGVGRMRWWMALGGEAALVDVLGGAVVLVARRHAGLAAAADGGGEGGWGRGRCSQAPKGNGG